MDAGMFCWKKRRQDNKANTSTIEAVVTQRDVPQRKRTNKANAKF